MVNQQELLDLTGGGETLDVFADWHGLDRTQLEGLAQYVTTPNMTSELFVDGQRLVFVHGPADETLVLEAVDTYGVTHFGDARVMPGVRMHVSRSPAAEMYSVHVIARVVPV